MADQRTMAKLLQAPTEGYEDAIVIPAILAKNFEIKHGLLNLVTSKQFYGFEKEDSHAHIRWFNKITSTIKYRDDRFKDLIRACPHHDFTELHQLDTFYNALTPTDRDSLNAAAGVNTNDLSSSTPHSLEIAALVDAVKAMLHQKSSHPAFVKAVEEIYVTCGGLHPYHQVLGFSDSSTSGNPTPSLDPILSTSSLALTPFEEGDFILEEIEDFLTNDSIPPGIDDDEFDP
ncbi:hypothetical protein Tco_1272272 [Tanacetum coccineum]